MLDFTQIHQIQGHNLHNLWKITTTMMAAIGTGNHATSTKATPTMMTVIGSGKDTFHTPSPPKEDPPRRSNMLGVSTWPAPSLDIFHPSYSAPDSLPPSWELDHVSVRRRGNTEQIRRKQRTNVKRTWGMLFQFQNVKRVSWNSKCIGGVWVQTEREEYLGRLCRNWWKCDINKVT